MDLKIEFANLGFRVTIDDYCRLFMFKDIVVFKTVKCLEMFSIAVRELKDYDITLINFGTKVGRDLVYKTLKRDFIMFGLKYATLVKSKHILQEGYCG